MNGPQGDRSGPDGPPPPPPPPIMPPPGSPSWSPAHRGYPAWGVPAGFGPPPGPADKPRRMLVALGCAGAVVGLALVILIAVTVGLSAAASVVGAAALLYGLLLLVTGTPMRLVPGDVRRSGSSSAVRVFAFVFVLFAAYSFAVAFEWPSAEFSFVGYLVVVAAAL